MKLRIYACYGLASLSVLGGCESYARTNPLDPGYGLQLSLVGPDTIFSINDTVRYELVTQPSHPELPFVWTTSSATRLPAVEGAPGAFTSLADGTAVITAEYGPHKLQKEVVVSQRAVRLGIATPPTTMLESLGEAVVLSASVVDAKNTPVLGATRELQWTSSDPAIAEVSGGRVTARGNGNAWIRATSFGQSDSVRIQVRQKSATIQFSSATYTISRPGGAVQTVVLVRDARGNPISSPEGLALRSSRSSFGVDPGGLVQSTGYGSARITAGVASLEATTLVRVVGGTDPEVTRLTAGLTRLDLAGSATDLLLVELEAQDAERDLDEATIDIYSTGNSFITQRLLELEQGTSPQTRFLVLPNVGQAGTARIRLRDAALNVSRLTIATVTTQPREESPDASIGSVSRMPGDSIEVTASVSDPQADARNLYLIGFDSAGNVVFSRRRSLPAGGAPGTHRIGARTPDGVGLSRIGLLVSDAQGNLSPVRTMSVSASVVGASTGSIGTSVGRPIPSTGVAR